MSSIESRSAPEMGDPSPGGFLNVEDAIEHIGFGKFQLGLVTYTGLIWLADAAEMILLSFIGRAARCEWKLSSFQEGAISSSVFVGVLLGSYCWGVLADLRGRRLSFFATVLFTTVFGFLSAWSPAFWFLLLARSCVGFGLGGSAVAFSLCMEFLPFQGRGFWLVFLQAFWTAGSIMEALLAWIIIPNFNWRWLVALSAVPFVLLLAFYPILPESPRYLMTKGDKDSALKVLQRIARVNGKKLPHALITVRPEDLVPTSNERDLAKSSSEQVSLLGQSTECDKQIVMDRSELGCSGALGAFKLLLSPELKKSTLLLWFIFFANAFVYYGLVLLTTELQSTGGKTRACEDASTLADVAQCNRDNTPIIETSQYRTALITCIAEVPGLIVACLMVTKFGHKTSQIALLTACGMFVLPLMVTLNEVATNILMFGSRSCIMGGFSILWAYAPELYYTKVRTTGVGSASSFGRLGGFLCPFVAVGLIESCQRVVAIALFSFISILAGLLTFLIPRSPPQPAAATKESIEIVATGLDTPR